MASDLAEDEVDSFSVGCHGYDYDGHSCAYSDYHGDDQENPDDLY